MRCDTSTDRCAGAFGGNRPSVIANPRRKRKKRLMLAANPLRVRAVQIAQASMAHATAASLPQQRQPSLPFDATEA